MDKRIEIIEKILSTMPTAYDAYGSEEEAEQADPFREKEIVDLSNISEIAQAIVDQLDQLVKPQATDEDMNYKIQRMREFAENAYTKKIRPLEYYFCRYDEPDEDYLIPIPAQHPILETPIFRIIKAP